MEGTLKTLKEGFGFIEESTTKRLWYFHFSDLTLFQMIREGFKVRFEKKDNTQESSGDDETEWIYAMRNLFRKGRLPQAPAAHKVEILESVPEPEPILFNPVLKAMPDARRATEKGED